MKIKLSKTETIGWILGTIISLALILGAYQKWVPISLTEVLGFVTGALTVWLTVKENIWNWPIGIANEVFFIILFLQVRLFADTGLQVVYLILSFYGWYWWLKGGKNKSELTVTKTPFKEIPILVLLAIISTLGMMYYLRTINDSAPFLDALTTVMSLVAQYMLTRKYIENWLVWISADVIYIYLYFVKALPLTGVLYFIFLCMCIAGFKQWKKSLQIKKEEIVAHPGVTYD